MRKEAGAQSWADVLPFLGCLSLLNSRMCNGFLRSELSSHETGITNLSPSPYSAKSFGFHFCGCTDHWFLDSQSLWTLHTIIYNLITAGTTKQKLDDILVVQTSYIKKFHPTAEMKLFYLKMRSSLISKKLENVTTTVFYGEVPLKKASHIYHCFPFSKHLFPALSLPCCAHMY